MTPSHSFFVCSSTIHIDFEFTHFGRMPNVSARGLINYTILGEYTIELSGSGDEHIVNV
jgi:hypothetical protein